MEISVLEIGSYSVLVSPSFCITTALLMDFRPWLEAKFWSENDCCHFCQRQPNGARFHQVRIWIQSRLRWWKWSFDKKLASDRVTGGFSLTWLSVSFIFPEGKFMKGRVWSCANGEAATWISFSSEKKAFFGGKNFCLASKVDSFQTDAQQKRLNNYNCRMLTSFIQLFKQFRFNVAFARDCTVSTQSGVWHQNFNNFSDKARETTCITCLQKHTRTMLQMDRILGHKKAIVVHQCVQPWVICGLCFIRDTKANITDPRACNHWEHCVSRGLWHR